MSRPHTVELIYHHSSPSPSPTTTTAEVFSEVTHSTRFAVDNNPAASFAAAAAALGATSLNRKDFLVSTPRILAVHDGLAHDVGLWADRDTDYKVRGVAVRERRFRVYEEAPGFRPGHRDVAAHSLPLPGCDARSAYAYRANPRQCASANTSRRPASAVRPRHPPAWWDPSRAWPSDESPSRHSRSWQGLTLVHFTAQCMHLLWDTLGGLAGSSTGAKAEAWCLLIHADASLSLGGLADKDGSG